VGDELVMPRLLARLLYAIRGKRRVRYHLFDGNGGEGISLEGVELGCWAGHYVAILPRHLQAQDRAVALDGTIEIARERVIFRQVLA
jgi:hypothetical protein